MQGEASFDVGRAATEAREASRLVACLPTATKDAVLGELAARIGAASAEILHANKADLEQWGREGLGGAKLRRLELSEASLTQLRSGVLHVAALPDPVGKVTRDERVPSGLRVRKVRAPLGVILMIYESRPNVTVDAFCLAFKAGNACLLKGGKEAARSNRVLMRLCRESLGACGAPLGAVQLVDTSDRERLAELLRMEDRIDLVIPRGSKELIRAVREQSRIPTIQHFEGVNHIYVDEGADLGMAVEVCATAKTSAPATCNAVECLLVHEKIAGAFVPRIAERFAREGVELRADEAARALAPGAAAAAPGDWGQEFLDLVCAMRVVGSMDEAIAHIERYGSNHTEAILTRDEGRAEEFTARVQSSVVMVNASTRFNDGFQLGLGAEIGISTSRMHAYGPMGLEELTTQRYVVVGDGQTR